MPHESDMVLATFAAGCFWGVQAAFQQLEGVIQTRAGYTGGDTQEPTYEQVCSDITGHAESVEVFYDPHMVSYRQLLELFFSIHDPTELNRQGPDEGSQYRSVIFYHNAEQKELAEHYIRELNATPKYRGVIETRIEPASDFWEAEEYHQSYFLKMGRRYGGII